MCGAYFDFVNIWFNVLWGLQGHSLLGGLINHFVSMGPFPGVLHCKSLVYEGCSKNTQTDAVISSVFD